MFSIGRAAGCLAVSAVALSGCSAIGGTPAATTYVQMVTVTPSASTTQAPAPATTQAAPTTTAAAATTVQAPAPAVTTVVQVPARQVTTVVQAPAPAPAAVTSCSDYYAQWDAAVRANSKSRSKRVHAQAAAAGCDPDTWLPSRSKTTYDPNTAHYKGQPCTMKEVGTYDAVGMVCTQDQPGNPHWN